uniref:Amyloid-like protein 1 n=1 Tax=Lygus hesperus TaxID=30085 RepID=A0A0A9W1M6_LYGHE
MDIQDRSVEEVGELLCTLFQDTVVEYNLCTLYGVLQNALKTYKRSSTFTTIDTAESEATAAAGSTQDEQPPSSMDDRTSSDDQDSSEEDGAVDAVQKICHTIPQPSSAVTASMARDDDDDDGTWYRVSHRRRNHR